MTNIPALHVGRGLQVGPVTLFPVWADTPPVRDLRTGPTASVEVAEIDGAAEVGRLSVYNSGDKPVLLLEGELLEGGLQTRTLVRDVILAPRSRVDIEVVCVEQGRWAGGTIHGRRARRATASVQTALRGDDGSWQARVWDGVRRYESVTGPTASGSLTDHLDRVATPAVPRLLAGQNGVIVGVAGQPVTLELFGTRAALKAHLPGIVDAALLEAELLGATLSQATLLGATLTGPAIRVPARRARRFAEMVETIDWHATDADPCTQSWSAGQSWSGRSEQATLRALTVGSGLAHLSAVSM